MKEMKKKKRKTPVYWIVVALAIFCICLSVFTHFWSKTEHGCQFIFEWDQREMQQVADYLISLDEYSDVYIGNPFGKMIVGVGGQKEAIKDLKIRLIVLHLFLKGYDRIEKNEGKTISFQRWYDGFERDRGYAFSVDGSEELSIEYLTESRAMLKNDWYSYTSDYNEWRGKTG